MIFVLYIGGRGLGVKIYYDLMNPDIDPFSPENLLIFTTGPLTGLLPHYQEDMSWFQNLPLQHDI